MIYINDKEVNLIYNLGTKVKEVFSYGTKIWPKEVLFDYMFFKLADGYTSGNVSYKFDEYYNLHNKYLKISTDGSNWNDWTEAISMTQNVKYYIKGEDNYVRNSDKPGGFFSSDVSQNAFNIECGGNVMSLCNNATEITVPYCLRSLFHNMTNLVTAPKLPATTLVRGCYKSMFNNCSSLTEAPELPATTLEDDCYAMMFYKSNKLNWIKALFTDWYISGHTKNWVNGVSAQGVFVKNIDAEWEDTDVNVIPPEWQIIYYNQTEDKYYTTQTKEEECDKYGNPLGAARMKLFTRKPTDVGIFWDPEAELFDNSDNSDIEVSEYMSE